MFSEEQKAEALEIVRGLFEIGLKEHLHYLKGDRPHRTLYNWIYSREGFNGIQVTFESGETKVCIIPYSCEYVIKLPLMYISENEDDESLDYCQIEAFNYQMACEKGVEQFFAAMERIGEVEDCPVYLQEYARAEEDVFESAFFEYIGREYDDENLDEDDIYDRMEEMSDDDRLYAIMEDQGCNSEEIIKLSAFTMQFDINDLHSGNWGITNNGYYVLIDYSGFSGYGG